MGTPFDITNPLSTVSCCENELLRVSACHLFIGWCGSGWHDMARKQSTFGDREASFAFEVYKSRQSFTNLFENAVRLHCITYCESPEILLELFDEYALEELEVVVGDIVDYRERLIDKPEVADRLERLKETGDLRIYTCPTKTVHSKLYEVEYEDESLTLLCGLPNLTRTGWRNQTNAGVAFETTRGTAVHDAFREMYDDHRDSYGELFLDDLTEEIEASEQDREEIIERWVEGRTSETDEIEEIHGTLTEKLVTTAEEHVDADAVVVNGAIDVDEDTEEDTTDTQTPDDELPEPPEEEMVVSLKGYSDRSKKRVDETFSGFGTVTGDQLRITPRGYGKQLTQIYGVPKMHVDRDERHLTLTAGEAYRTLGAESPSDSDVIDRSLSQLEAYFETVDDYAQTNHPTVLKTHMYEALLYLFWAPFANLHAAQLRRNSLQLDKRLPFLFIYGESNSGKGTFTKFALNLLSDGQVTGALDADDFGKRRVRAIRKLDTCFPLVIDDIKKSRISQTDTLRNYWSEWNDDRNYPALVFISNDTKPDEWFRNRAKLIHFDGQFTSNIEGEAIVNRLIERRNPAFHWFTSLYLDQNLGLHDDPLADTRAVFSELYDRANREVPEYFPERPAEEIYDTGRRRWQQAWTENKYTERRENSRLHLEFVDDMESYEILRFRRDLPERVRAEKYGNDLVIKTPEQFHDWIEEGFDGVDQKRNLQPIERIRNFFE